MVSVGPLIAVDRGHHTWRGCQSARVYQNKVLEFYLVAGVVVEAAVAEVVAHSFRTAVVVVPSIRQSVYFCYNFGLQNPQRMPLTLRRNTATYLIVSILLRRRSRLSVVVVLRLWALVPSILLWRTGVRQRMDNGACPVVYSRRAVVLLWRRIALLGRATIVALWWWWCTVATAATAAVVLLSGIIRHVELRSGGGEGYGGRVEALWS